MYDFNLRYPSLALLVADCVPRQSVRVLMESPRESDAARAVSDRQHAHSDDAEPFGGSAPLAAIAPQLISAKSSPLAAAD